MRIKRNLLLADIYTVSANMICIMPVIIPYYRDEIGLTFQHFLIGESFFAATLILLDVPMGWLSDVWKRKNAQSLGFLALAVGYGSLLFAKSLFMAIVGQSIIGVGIALINGTATSIIYESLLSVGREAEYRRREGRRMALGFYTAALAGIVGGLVYPLNHKLPLLIEIGALFAGLAATLLLDEPERHKPPRDRHPVLDILATIKYAVHGHKEIGFILMFAASLFCSTKLIMWSQQPYYMALKIPEHWFGFLTAIGFGLGGAASHASHLLDGKVGPTRALALIWAAALAICFGAAAGSGWLGVALLMLGGTCLYGMAQPRVNEVINTHVDSARRATVLSTQGLLVSALFIPLSTIMGWLSRHGGIHTSLLGIAVWLCFAGVMLAGLSRRRSSARASLQ